MADALALLTANPIDALIIAGASLVIAALGVFRQGGSQNVTDLATELDEKRKEIAELKTEASSLRREREYWMRRCLRLENGSGDK